MKKGVSLHIGVNSLDTAHYGANLPTLKGCENDAKEMKLIADKNGFASKTLLSKNATTQAVLSEIRSASKLLVSGDIFFLTYSGHGATVPNINQDEEDTEFDQTWCLFDRMLIDDELRSEWKLFRPGVRIFIVSDSCHSGTVFFSAAFNFLSAPFLKNDRKKFIPTKDADEIYSNHKSLYDEIQTKNPPFNPDNLKAGVVLLAACQDKQTTKDGTPNSKFTKALLTFYTKNPAISIEEFHKKLSNFFKPVQSPKLSAIGNIPFITNQIFTI